MEMLVSLSLLGLILAAIATAVNSSVVSYAENDRIAEVSQTSRITLNRITSSIRTAQSVSVDEAHGTLTVLPTDVTVRQIVYKVDRGSLCMFETPVGGTEQRYPLIDGTGDVRLVSFSIKPVMGSDWQFITCTKTVSMKLGLMVGQQLMFITASADPRKNQLF